VSSNNLSVAHCISLHTQASSKELCVEHCNYSWVRASSSDICIYHCTYSQIQASSSDLCVTHCSSSHALFSSMALYASHINFLCWATSNLGGGCATFIIFPSGLWPKISPFSKSIHVFYLPHFITHKSTSSSLLLFMCGSVITMLQCVFISSHFFKNLVQSSVVCLGL